MGRREASWLVGAVVVACLGNGLSAQVGARRDQPVLRRVERRTARTRIGADGALPLRSATGERIGTWLLAPEGAELRPDGQRSVLGPRLQHWVGSPDGRTLAGAGEPGAPEHPFALEVVVLRDGERIATLPEKLGTESSLTVSADGHVAIVGHRDGERGRPFALLLRPDGTPLFRIALPEGTLARDPLLFGERLLVRVHDVLAAGTHGEVLAVDELGVHTLLGDEGVRGLTGFPEAGRALALTRDGLAYLDAFDGRVLWRSAHAIRPAGPNAWALTRSGPSTALAVVTAGVKKRGMDAPVASLVLLDEADGAWLAGVELGAASPLAEVDVAGDARRLVVDWNGTEEVFTW
jgi:hypothetical protein